MAEIVVVFIGVYLAFLLEGYRTEQKNEHKRQQIYTALHKNFTELSIELEGSIANIDSSYFKSFMKDYKDEKMPRLQPLPFFTGGLTDDTWGAMLQAGGIDLLDVNFILLVDRYFSNFRSITQNLKNTNQLYNQYLLPNLSADISTFYNTETKEIRPSYRWYVQFINSFPDVVRKAKKMTDNIIIELEEKMNKKQLKKIKTHSLEAAKQDSLERAKTDSSG